MRTFFVNTLLAISCWAAQSAHRIDRKKQKTINAQSSEESELERDWEVRGVNLTPEAQAMIATTRTIQEPEQEEPPLKGSVADRVERSRNRV